MLTLEEKLDYRPTPLQEIPIHPAIVRAGIRLLVKREDLNHPTITGNKWWKLKYNILAAQQSALSTVLTFGGAYSNHIYATAAACAQSGLKSIGIIRGEEVRPLNATLQFAQEAGMKLHYVSRAAYREKHHPEFIAQLHDRFGDFYHLPEGGSNALAIQGCAEFATKELGVIDFDHLVLAVGTGGTMAGIVCGLADARNVLGVPVLKNGEFLADAVAKMAFAHSETRYKNWSLLTAYHHGGYAKTTMKLLDFIREMETVYSLPLDRIYTGKALYGLIKEVEAGSFKRGDTVLFLHTGGLRREPPRTDT